MKESAAILEIAFDCVTAWNLRHDSLELICNSLSDADSLTKYSEELKFTQLAIMKNPKIYCHWEYRRYILQQAYNKRQANPTVVQAIIAKEYRLCWALLDLDSRNFHCWNHRKWLSNLVDASIEDELTFTNDFRQKDPGNYSALHHRSMILSKRWSKIDPAFVFIEILDGLNPLRLPSLISFHIVLTRICWDKQNSSCPSQK